MLMVVSFLKDWGYENKYYLKLFFLNKQKNTFKKLHSKNLERMEKMHKKLKVV